MEVAAVGNPFLFNLMIMVHLIMFVLYLLNNSSCVNT